MLWMEAHQAGERSEVPWQDGCVRYKLTDVADTSTWSLMPSLSTSVAFYCNSRLKQVSSLC